MTTKKSTKKVIKVVEPVIEVEPEPEVETKIEPVGEDLEAKYKIYCEKNKAAGKKIIEK